MSIFTGLGTCLNYMEKDAIPLLTTMAGTGKAVPIDLKDWSQHAEKLNNWGKCTPQDKATTLAFTADACALHIKSFMQGDPEEPVILLSNLTSVLDYLTRAVPNDGSQFAYLREHCVASYRDCVKHIKTCPWDKVVKLAGEDIPIDVRADLCVFINQMEYYMEQWWRVLRRAQGGKKNLSLHWQNAVPALRRSVKSGKDLSKRLSIFCLSVLHLVILHCADLLRGFQELPNAAPPYDIDQVQNWSSRCITATTLGLLPTGFASDPNRKTFLAVLADVKGQAVKGRAPNISTLEKLQELAGCISKAVTTPDDQARFDEMIATGLEQIRMKPLLLSEAQPENEVGVPGQEVGTSDTDLPLILKTAVFVSSFSWLLLKVEMVP